MKYTTLLIVALLATATLAASGCDKGKCASCAAAGNDETCLACYKSKPAFPAGVTTYQNCSATSTEGCILASNTACGACDVATHFMSLVTATAGTCLKYWASGTTVFVKKPTDVNCTASLSTDATADATGKCVSCKGTNKPGAGTTETPACTPITTTAVSGCAAHTGDSLCQYCSAGTVTTDTPNTCVAWTDKNKGCLLTANCDMCSVWAGYYSVSSKEPRCSMSSAILSVAGMIVALFLANF
jgi:hypothetical protein